MFQRLASLSLILIAGILCAATDSLVSAQVQPPPQPDVIAPPVVHPIDFKFTAKQKWVKRQGFAHPVEPGHRAFFVHRDKMARKLGAEAPRFAKLEKLPATILPVDCTGNASVNAPMDGNDTYGDCGEAMLAHADNILTFGQGKPGFTGSTFTLSSLTSQYLKVSGGDNGMDESMCVGSQGVWTVGIGGNKLAIALDSLDVDPTNVPLTQYLIDQFYTIQMAWSVPDAFLNDFTTGASFLSAMTPDPNNGHYTPITDLDAKGNMRLYTWGGWCWVSQAFIQSVQPEYFVGFSPRQFNAQGYDSHGRHASTQAAVWVSLGGSATKAAKLVAMFPPIAPPIPVVLAPVITSPVSAAGTVGKLFTYQIVASNSPTSFSATGLPSGFIVSANGLISGTPTLAATTTIAISATNVSGTGKANLTLTVGTVTPPPSGGLGTITITLTGQPAKMYELFPPGTAAQQDAAIDALIETLKGMKQGVKPLEPPPLELKKSSRLDSVEKSIGQLERLTEMFERKLDSLPTKGKAIVSKPIAPARITVWCEPSAYIEIDGIVTNSKHTYRRFDTPPLPAGEWWYNLLIVDSIGRRERSVSVWAGKESVVDFRLGA